MILVLGGIASGKRAYARACGYDDTQMNGDPNSPEPVLYGLEETLRSGPLDEDAVEALMHKELVCCCEIGLGVVPLDAEDREWRELVGRTCIMLAGRAERVVRMICGIPITIRYASDGMR